MPIPTPKQLSRPILEVVADAKEDVVSKQYIRESLCELFSLTDDDLRDLMPSGQKTRFEDRLYDGIYYLKNAGLLQSPSRTYFQITKLGREVLAKVTGDLSNSNKELRSLIAENKGQPVVEDDVDVPGTIDGVGTDSEDSTPHEQIAALYQKLSNRLAEELLEQVKRVSPADFERLVVRLLEKMGYGEGQTVGGSGDGGIDGVINQDALGLEKVYIQAKRWQSQVGEPEIRNFSGSLDGEGANKGVFITSSSFGPRASGAARRISAGNKFIRLIDGEELARLMINHGVAVVSEITYDVKKLDENYFAEDG